MSAGTFDFLKARVNLELAGHDKVDAGLLSTQAKLKALAATTAKASAALTATGAAIIAPLAGAYRSFARMQSNIAMVSTMLEEPQKHIPGFSKKLDELRVKYGETGDALSKGLYDILSASIAPQKATEVLEVAVRSAKAGFTDAAVAVDAMTTILNSYKLSADKAGDVSDWMFGVVMRGKTTYGELAQNIGMVAKTASAAGVELEDLGAMVALMTRNGIRTPIAISSINSFITKLTAASEESKRVAKEMFNIDLSQQGFKDGGGLLGMLEKLRGANVEQLRKLFPDAEAARAIIALVSSVDELGGDIEALRDRAGATDKAFAKVFGTAQMSMDKLGEAVKIAYEKVGEALDGMVSGKLDEWKRDIGDLTMWIEKNKETLLDYATLGMKFAEMGVYFIALSAGIKATSIALGGFNVLNSVVTNLVKAGGWTRTFIQLWREFGLKGASFAAGISSGLGKIIENLKAGKIGMQGFTAAALAAAVAGYAIGNAFKDALKYKGQFTDTNDNNVNRIVEESANTLERTQRLRALAANSGKNLEELREQAELVKELGQAAGLTAEKINQLVTDNKGTAQLADLVDIQALERSLATQENQLQAFIDNRREAQKELDDLTSNRRFSVLEDHDATMKRAVDKVDEWRQKEVDAFTRIHRLRQQLGRLQSGSTGEGVDPEVKRLAKLYELEQNAQTATEERQRLEKDMAKDNLSAHEKEIKAIQEKYDVLQKLLEAEMAYARATQDPEQIRKLEAMQATAELSRKKEMEKVGEDVERDFTKYDKRRNQTELEREIETITKQAEARIELLRAKLRHEEEMYGSLDPDESMSRIVEYQSRIFATERIMNARIEAAKAEALREQEKQFEKNRQSLEDEREGFGSRRQQRQEDRYLDRIAIDDPESAAKLLNVLMERARKKAEDAYREAEELNRQALADGKIDEDEQRGIDSARSRYSDSETAFDRYAQRLDALQQNAREELQKTVEVRGAFGSSAAALGFGLQEAKDPNVEHNKRTADGVDKLVADIEKGIPVVLAMS